MRKKYSVGLLVFLCGILLCFSGVHASEDDVIANDASGIPDRELYQRVLEEVEDWRSKNGLPKREGEAFTRREAEQLKTLWAPNGGVQDLTGIGCLGNLEILSIEDYSNAGANGFESLQPLQDLKRLKKLKIDRSQSLESLAGIEGLVRLKRLHLARSGLKSLSGIEGLTELKELHADYGRLASLKGIEGLTKLEWLTADGNRLKSVKEIRPLKKLVRVSLNDNRLTKGNEIRHLKRLSELYIAGNRLTDIGAVSHLKKLQFLDVSNNRLKKTPEMKWGPYVSLDFRGNRLSEGELNAGLKKCLDGESFTADWLRDQIMFQDNYRIRPSSPRSLKKITKNTRKITGRIKRSGPYQGEIYVSVNDKESRWNNSRVKVDAGGSSRQRGRKTGL